MEISKLITFAVLLQLIVACGIPVSDSDTDSHAIDRDGETSFYMAKVEYSLDTGRNAGADQRQCGDALGVVLNFVGMHAASTHQESKRGFVEEGQFRHACFQKDSGVAPQLAAPEKAADKKTGVCYGESGVEYLADLKAALNMETKSDVPTSEAGGATSEAGGATANQNLLFGLADDDLVGPQKPDKDLDPNEESQITVGNDSPKNVKKIVAVRTITPAESAECVSLETRINNIVMNDNAAVVWK